MLPFQLKNQTAIVTGGGTGLGLGITKCLVQAGAKVVITGRREDVLKQAAQELGANAIPMVVDVTDTRSLPAFVERVTKEVGPVDILVNNAGIHVKKPALEMTDEDFNSVLHTHLTGAFALTYRTSEHSVEELLDRVRTAGVSIKDLSIEEADLEDVFMELTSSR